MIRIVRPDQAKESFFRTREESQHQHDSDERELIARVERRVSIVHVNYGEMPALSTAINIFTIPVLYSLTA